MKVLVTGSSGHVGGVIATQLMGEGHEVIGLGRRMTDSNRALSGAIAADLGRPGLARLLATDQPRCEAIVHAAAALEREPFASQISLTNCFGTHQMLDLGARWRVASFVFLSSVRVIGRPRELPITEEHPVDPPSAYHASKFYGESLLAIAQREGIPALTLRLTSPIGPRMPDGRIVSVFVRRALEGDRLEVMGHGTRCQDYVDVRDIAAAVLAALDRRATGLLNIGSGRCVPNRDLAHRCVDVLGSTSQVTVTGTPDPEEGTRWEVSIEAASRALGYRPQHSLEDSIAALAGELRVITDA